MSLTSDRVQNYKESYDFKIMQRLPIVVWAEIRNFGKLTKNLPKPYSKDLIDIMQKTMLQSVMDIESAVFSYSFNGEISIILKNDDENTWLNNRIQDINSTITSLLSINFLKNYLASDYPPDIIGEAVFITNVFPVPSFTEMAKYLSWRQSSCVHTSVVSGIDTLTGPGYKGDLESKTLEEKKQIFFSKSGISINEYYHSSFINGSACYKVLKNQKKKWQLDTSLPLFWEDDFAFLKESINS